LEAYQLDSKLDAGVSKMATYKGPDLKGCIELAIKTLTLRYNAMIGAWERILYLNQIDNIYTYTHIYIG